MASIYQNVYYLYTKNIVRRKYKQKTSRKSIQIDQFYNWYRILEQMSIRNDSIPVFRAIGSHIRYASDPIFEHFCSSST